MTSDFQSSRIPVWIITGFLGSGKTTLLNHLVQQPAFHNTLVIINELGEISLDHLLVTHSNEDMVMTMDNGCICCNIRRDLSTVLKQITWRFSRNGKRQFDRVVIETTGLADPAPVIHTLMIDETINERYCLNAIITTIDCFNGLETLALHSESAKQAALADHLILTKSDLIDTAQLAALCWKLTSLNPAARQLLAVNGKIDARELSDERFFPSDRQTLLDITTWLDGNNYEYPSTHNRFHFKPVSNSNIQAMPETKTRYKAPDHSNHDDNIKSFCLIFSEPLEPELFDQWLGLLVGFKGENLLRVKGILNLKYRFGPTVIHGVQHIFHPPMELAVWPSEDHRTRIVFITRDLDPSIIERTFNAFASKNSATL